MGLSKPCGCGVNYLSPSCDRVDLSNARRTCACTTSTNTKHALCSVSMLMTCCSQTPNTALLMICFAEMSSLSSKDLRVVNNSLGLRIELNEENGYILDIEVSLAEAIRNGVCKRRTNS